MVSRSTMVQALTWKNWLRACGSVLVLLSVISLLGRSFNSWAVASVFPNGNPMAGNSALSQILLGVAFWLIAAGRRRFAEALGWIVFGFAGLIGSQHLTGVSLGIDEWFVRHEFPPVMPNPGRMAPNTAISFLLAGLTLVQLARPRARTVLLSLNAGVLLGFSLLAVVGYSTGLKLTLVGGISIGMSFATALSLGLIAITAVAGMRRSTNEMRPARPLGVTAVMLLAAVGLFAFDLNASHEAARRRQIRSYEIVASLNYAELCLTRMESATRAYVIATDRGQLNYKRDIDGRLRAELNHLESLIGNEPDQQARFGVLRQLIGRKRAYIERLVAARQEEGEDAAVALLRGPEGTDLMEQVREQVNLIEEFERGRQKEGDRLVGETSYATTKVIVLGNVLAGLFSFIALYLSRRAEDARLRAEVRLRESNRLQRAVLDGTVFSVIATEPDGLIREFNSGAERMLGYTRDEMVGRQTPEILHVGEELVARAAELRAGPGRPADAGFAAVVAEAGAAGIDEREWTYVRKDGGRFPVLLSVTALRGEGGEVTGFVAIAQDVTARKEAEAELARARDQALEASRLKSQFLANMSHEIRTPMNGVIGMTGLLRESNLSADQRQMATVVQNSAESLMTIIDDILDFSKIEAGKFRIEPAELSLVPLIEEVVTLLAPRAHAKGIELNCEIAGEFDRLLLGDGGRIRQVLLNLLGNAVKFTDQGEVAVRATCAPVTAASRRVRVEVRDTGIGIATEAQRHLFQPFVQGDGTSTRRYGGTGLGLAISRQLIELMAGRIGVESEPGRGSTFWFEIELPAAAPLPPEAKEELLAGLRVMVVEDHEGNRRSLLRQLAALQIDAVAAASALAAINELAAAPGDGRPFRVALLASSLTGISGVDLAKLLRSNPATAGLKLILMSPADAAGAQPAAGAEQLDGLLLKPVQQSPLKQVLGRALRNEPATAAPRPLLPPAVTAGGAGSGRHLLVAEDNTTNQYVARQLLEKMGHRVTVAANGEEAIRVAAAGRFDAILMDCQMPEMDGYTATRRIRSGQAAIPAGIPIIALTAYAGGEDREKCLRAGMNDYLSKPLRYETLQVALQRVGVESPGVAPTPDRAPGPSGNDNDPGGAIVDPDQLERLRRLPGRHGPELLHEVLAVFLREAPEQIRVINELAGTAGRWDEVARAAHRLAGSCANLGAERLRQVALALESDVREQLYDGIPDRLVGLDHEWVKLELHLKNIPPGAAR